MMDFKEFTTRAEQDIRAALEDASPGVGVGMNQVEKLQGESYTAKLCYIRCNVNDCCNTW